MGICGPNLSSYLIVISFTFMWNTDIWRQPRLLAMAVSFLLRFIFPPPPYLFITGISAITLLAILGFYEVRGKELQYSKFWNVNSPKHGRKQINVYSRTGMLFVYAPAFLVCFTSFVLFQHQDVRFLLLDAALTLHFFKRIFEVKLHLNTNFLQIWFLTMWFTWL